MKFFRIKFYENLFSSLGMLCATSIGSMQGVNTQIKEKWSHLSGSPSSPISSWQQLAPQSAHQWSQLSQIDKRQQVESGQCGDNGLGLANPLVDSVNVSD